MGKSDFHRSICSPMDGPFSRHTRFGGRLAKTTVDLSGSMTLPSLNVPRSQTPSQSPITIASCGDLLLPSRFSTLSACDFVSRGSIASLTLQPAHRSHLRLTHFVTSMSPRLDSRWGGSFPLPVRELHPLEAPGLA
jgi:hypothetical protein